MSAPKIFDIIESRLLFLWGRELGTLGNTSEAKTPHPSTLWSERLLGSMPKQDEGGSVSAGDPWWVKGGGQVIRFL